jgi:adenylate kinase
VPQAEALDRMLEAANRHLDHVILMEVDEQALIERIAGRFSCRGCGASFHERYHRPRTDGVCDVCGGTNLVHRADDRPEAVATRLAAYRNQTAPLLPYYRDRGVLRTVDGMADIDEVTRQIETVLRAGSS